VAAQKPVTKSNIDALNIICTLFVRHMLVRFEWT
jgi:hypothetical protein